MTNFLLLLLSILSPAQVEQLDLCTETSTQIRQVQIGNDTGTQTRSVTKTFALCSTDQKVRLSRTVGPWSSVR